MINMQPGMKGLKLLEGVQGLTLVFFFSQGAHALLSLKNLGVHKELNVLNENLSNTVFFLIKGYEETFASKII